MGKKRKKIFENKKRYLLANNKRKTKEKNKKTKLRKPKKQYLFPGSPSRSSPSERKKLIVKMLFRMQNEKCFYCNVILVIPSIKQCNVSGNYATIDHIMPLSKGGLSELHNLLLACSNCNSKRGARWINPVTGQKLSFPLDFGKRWDFLTERDKNEMG